MFALLQQFRAQDRVVQILLINELTIFGSSTPTSRSTSRATSASPRGWSGSPSARVFSPQGLTVIGGTLADRIGYRPIVIARLFIRTN